MTAPTLDAFLTAKARAGEDVTIISIDVQPGEAGPAKSPAGQHTPGPWACFYKHKYAEWHVSIPMPQSAMRLALFPNGVQSANPEADARLIAAAPDLLAALRRLVAISDRNHEAWTAAKATIAMALGHNDSHR